MILPFLPVRDAVISRCLEQFFQFYLSSGSSSHHVKVLSLAFIPTLQLVLDAPSTSPLSEIDANVVARWMIGYMANPYVLSAGLLGVPLVPEPSNLVAAARMFESIRLSLACKLCEEIYRAGKGTYLSPTPQEREGRASFVRSFASIVTTVFCRQMATRARR